MCLNPQNPWSEKDGINDLQKSNKTFLEKLILRREKKEGKTFFQWMTGKIIAVRKHIF
jgi:hypothetical protein